MSNILKLKKTILGITVFILFLTLLVIGSMTFLSLGRYLGTIVKYAVEGNICLF